VHQVDCVVDVRTLPFSAHHSQYDKPGLGTYLKAQGLAYRHMPEEFGARQESPTFLRGGQLDFECFAKSPAFLRGCEEIVHGTQDGTTFVLMCAEKDPAFCLRAILVSRYFHEQKWFVRHLKPNGVETQAEMEHRLVNLLFPRRHQLSIFEVAQPEEEWIRQAYREQNKRIGYVRGA